MMMRNRLLLEPAVNGQGGGAAAPAAATPAAAPPAPAATPSAQPSNSNPTEIKPAVSATPGEGAKPADSGKPEAENAKAPEKFSLKVPDGTSLDPAVLEKYAADMQARGLTSEQAQAILEADITRGREYQKAQADAQKAAVVEQDKAWAAEIQKLHGAKFGETAEAVTRALDWADPDKKFRGALEASGLSHNPLLFGVLAKFAGLLKNDTLHAPSVGTTTKPKLSPREAIIKYHEEQEAARSK